MACSSHNRKGAVAMILHHYWVCGADGSPILYEAAYQSYTRQPGVVCHVKIPFSDRPCTCQERDAKAAERLKFEAVDNRDMDREPISAACVTMDEGHVAGVRPEDNPPLDRDLHHGARSSWSLPSNDAGT
jgi:hypothetical protein